MEDSDDALSGFARHKAIKDEPPERGLADLVFFLSLPFDPDLVPEARRRLFTRWGETTNAATTSRLEPALASVLRQSGSLEGLPRLRTDDQRISPPLWVEQVWGQHLERRATMARHLESVVAILNARGMVPLLLKGARSLWVDDPDWRSMRDLDVLVPSADEADAGQAALIAAGYTEGRQGRQGRHHAEFHHASNLYHSDLPGWIEVHRSAGPPRVELVLKTDDLFSAAVLRPRAGLRALVLPPSHDALQNLAHHHYGHREARQGSLEIKGLFEFAMSLKAMSEIERAVLVERASRHNRLLATLDLWIAIISDQFAVGEITPLPLEADAAARWRRMKVVTRRPGKLAALGEELRLALATARLKRCVGGDRSLGRLRMRCATALWAATSFGTRHY